MIEKDNNKLNELKDRQPFLVPESYFEGFTDDFMSRLPKRVHEAKVISLYDRVKPWLYLAAMFAGIIVLFNIYNKSAEVINKDEHTIYTSISISADNDAVDDETFYELYEDMLAMSHIDDYLSDN